MSDQITIYHIKCHLIRHSTHTRTHTHTPNNSLSLSFPLILFELFIVEMNSCVLKQ